MDALNKDIIGAAMAQLNRGDVPDVVTDTQLRRFKEQMPAELIEKKITEYKEIEKRKLKEAEEKEKQIAEKIGEEKQDASQGALDEAQGGEPFLSSLLDDSPEEQAQVESEEDKEISSSLKGLYEEKENPFGDLFSDIPAMDAPQDAQEEKGSPEAELENSGVSDLLEELLPSDEPSASQEGTLSQAPLEDAADSLEKDTSPPADLDEGFPSESEEPQEKAADEYGNAEEKDLVADLPLESQEQAIFEPSMSGDENLSPDREADVSVPGFESSSKDDDLGKLVSEGQSETTDEWILSEESKAPLKPGLETAAPEISEPVEKTAQDVDPTEMVDKDIADLSTQTEEPLEEESSAAALDDLAAPALEEGTPSIVDASQEDVPLDSVSSDEEEASVEVPLEKASQTDWPDEGKEQHLESVYASKDLMSELDSGEPVDSRREKETLPRPDFGSQESLFERAFDQLKTYTQEGRKIVYAAVVEKRLNEEQIEKVFSDLINLETENSLVQYIYDCLIKSPSFERAGDLAALRKRQFKEHFLPLFKYSAATLLLLSVLTALFVYTRDVFQAHYHYAKGLEAIEEHRFPESESHFEQAFDLKKDLGEINRYAEAYIRLGRYYDAQKKYQRALALDSKHFTTRHNLGKMYILKEDYEQAEQTLTSLRQDHPQEKEVRETMGRMYLNWAEKDLSKITAAREIWNGLLNEDRDHPYYLSKQIHMAALENDFYAAKHWHTRLKSVHSDYLEPIAHTRMTTLFVDEYQRHYVKKKAGRGHKRDEQLYLIQEIQTLAKELYEKHKDHLPIYTTIARWQLVIDKPENAERVVNRGINEYQRRGAGPTFNPYLLYQLQGMIYSIREKPIEAMTSFKTALSMNPQSSLDAFYIGKINLEELGNTDEALAYFNRAKLNWRDKKKTEYLELLNGLAYTYYQSALGQEGVSVLSKDKRLSESLSYWTELSRIWDQHYLLNFAKGNTYLRLGKHRLAIAEYESIKDDLLPAWEAYQSYSGSVTKDVQEKASVLSDVYNNLALAQMGAAFNRIDPVKNKTEALNNIINAIDMKDKMRVVKGTPIANFNRINDPQVKDIDQFKIADLHMPIRLPLSKS